MKEISIREKDVLFVWDKLLSKPLKLYAVLKGKAFKPATPVLPAKKKVEKVPTWSELHEIDVDLGKVTEQKNRLRIQAADTGNEIRFFKTLSISKVRKRIRYKLKPKHLK